MTNQTNGCLGPGVEGNKVTFVGDGNFSVSWCGGYIAKFRIYSLNKCS